MMTPLAELKAFRIALIKPSALGDIVHSLPVLSALRQRFPAAHITWIVNRAYEPLLHGHPDLDATLAFDRGPMKKSWYAGASIFWTFLKEIRRRQFDLVIDLQGLLRSGLMAWASGAKHRIGLSFAREGAARFYTETLPAAKAETHAVDRYWKVIEALGAGDLPKRFHLPLHDTDKQWAGERLQCWPRPWIMMNVGTRWETKRWPARHFAALAEKAVNRFRGTVVLVGGPDETPLAQTVVDALPQQALDMTGRTSLGQLIALLARSDVMVSNDSGPLHIAAALSRPVVAPYTCTSPVQTGPYGAANGVVQTQVWCAASYLKRCDRMDCMKELTPERLWPALEKALSSGQFAPH